VALPLKPEQFASAVGYCPRIQGFICKQKVEPIGGIEKPVRSRDRNRKTIRCKLARLYHGVDGAGTEVGGAVIVFFSFDDERHVAQHTPNCASHSGVERNLNPFEACAARAVAARQCIIYRRKQQRQQAAIDAATTSSYPKWVGLDARISSRAETQII
jgi:hypothetical protein